MAELLLERLTGVPTTGFTSPIVQWGTDHESCANPARQSTQGKSRAGVAANEIEAAVIKALALRIAGEDTSQSDKAPVDRKQIENHIQRIGARKRHLALQSRSQKPVR